LDFIFVLPQDKCSLFAGSSVNSAEVVAEAIFLAFLDLVSAPILLFIKVYVALMIKTATANEVLANIKP
jgi:hypothetical protein